MIKGDHLENHIRVGTVQKFKRSSGWVTIGIDPTRGQRGPYSGTERRIAENAYM